jgi:hypothetical protein
VQLAHFRVEAALVEGDLAAGLLLGRLGRHSGVRDVRIRAEQVMQVSDQEAQQVGIVEIGDKRQLDRPVEGRLARGDALPAAGIEQFRHQPAERDYRADTRRHWHGRRDMQDLAAIRTCRHECLSALGSRLSQHFRHY